MCNHFLIAERHHQMKTVAMKRMNIRELVSFCALDDAVENEDISEGFRLEDEDVLIE